MFNDFFMHENIAATIFASMTHPVIFYDPEEHIHTYKQTHKKRFSYLNNNKEQLGYIWRIYLAL